MLTDEDRIEIRNAIRSVQRGEASKKQSSKSVVTICLHCGQELRGWEEELGLASCSICRRLSVSRPPEVPLVVSVGGKEISDKR